MKNKNLPRILIGTALVLSVPLVAMQFSEEVNWDLADLVVIGTLLVGAGITFELVAARVNAKYRPIVALVITAAVLLVWAELAVGIFGTPFSGS